MLVGGSSAAASANTTTQQQQQQSMSSLSTSTASLNQSRLRASPIHGNNGTASTVLAQYASMLFPIAARVLQLPPLHPRDHQVSHIMSL